MTIRAARPEDVSSVIALIRELAEYEKLTDQLDVDAERLRSALFGAAPECFVLVATDGDADDASVVGYALYFRSFSTFKTRACLCLEDLYVTPRVRGRGVGKALLRGVAAEATARGCPRLDWCVLDWNQLAIDFYSSLGARILPDWRVCRIEGDALKQLAGAKSP